MRPTSVSTRGVGFSYQFSLARRSTRRPLDHQVRTGRFETLNHERPTMKSIAKFNFIAYWFLVSACAALDAPAGVESRADELSARPIGGRGAVCAVQDPPACPDGEHWDSQSCRCVTGCVDNVLCVQGRHWDSIQCTCVPDECISTEGGPCGGFTPERCECGPGLLCVANRNPDVAGRCERRSCCDAHGDDCTGAAERCPICDPIACPTGQRFDQKLCKCASTECRTASDCEGALPDLCRVCADGSTACAHRACIAGQCEVAYCP